MEGSRNPETMAPTSAKARSAKSEPPENLHSQMDAFLIAARLVRRGWRDDRKQMGKQFSFPESELSQRPNRPVIHLKDPSSGQSPAVMFKKTAGDKETGRKTGEGQQAGENRQTIVLLMSRQTGGYRQTGVFLASRQTGVVSARHSACRQFRRFKAPMLPAIAEI